MLTSGYLEAETQEDKHTLQIYYFDTDRLVELNRLIAVSELDDASEYDNFALQLSN